MKLPIRLSAAAALLVILSPAFAQSKPIQPPPPLTGKECIQQFCLGAELGDFSPGVFEHTTRHLTRIPLEPRSTVLRKLGTLYENASPQTLDELADELYATGEPMLRTPMSPTIHKALIEDEVRICGLAELRTSVAGRPNERWSIIFNAVPGSMVGKRQGWFLTSIEVETMGSFSNDHMRAQRATLNELAKPNAQARVGPRPKGMFASMFWNPIRPLVGNDTSVGSLSAKTRQMFGCKLTK